MRVRRLSLSGPFFREGSVAGWRELAAVYRVILGLPRDGSAVQAAAGSSVWSPSSRRDVVAAFREFARDRDARTVSAESFGGLQVVLAVRGWSVGARLARRHGAPSATRAVLLD